MNPGGDFGKKELSPALRNRFTEIWVSQTQAEDDLSQIIERHFEHPDLFGMSRTILDYVRWFTLETKPSTASSQSQYPLSLRDILAWIQFMNVTLKNGALDKYGAYVHGACLVCSCSFRCEYL